MPRQIKGIRGYRAITLMSLMAKWYAAMVVLLLSKEKEPEEWNELRVGCELRAYAVAGDELASETLGVA